jgi:hypothetical protein
MHDRSALGAADLSDAALTRLVGMQLGLDHVDLLDSTAVEVPYDLVALTTAGRYRVRGHAAAPQGPRPFSFFVKVVQSWFRSAFFEQVPVHMREVALAMLPWQVEPAVYRSDLQARLPEGLSMPTAFAVVDLDEHSAALWLEDIDAIEEPWPEERFAHAALLLGRLAASERVRATARVGRDGDQHLVRDYAAGRVAHQVLPALHDDAVWDHPLVAASFDGDLRRDLLRAADRLDAVVDELAAMPVGMLHGDACTRNLLVRSPKRDLVLIDYGFWSQGPVGFDLGQLIVGEVQMGERPAGDLELLEKTCLPAYVDGLREEGMDVELEVVRRAHALHMLVFTGLSALPVEHLGAPPSPGLADLARQRAQATRFILDLVGATG